MKIGVDKSQQANLSYKQNSTLHKEENEHVEEWENVVLRRKIFDVLTHFQEKSLTKEEAVERLIKVAKEEQRERRSITI